MDVRSPGEFETGHIPGALSFPLFNDEERARVGTLYKQTGRLEAILTGLEITGPKMRRLVEQALQISEGKPLFIHCWRGGMRSANMALLLQSAGLQCSLLRHGYKAYRRLVRESIALPRNYRVLGGKTGSGKTEIIRALHHMGEQVIDLEALARHKGSAFGRLGELPQPSNEQFGNDLFRTLSTFDPNRTIWVEDESRMIGNVVLPTEFYMNYRRAPLMVIELPFEQRLHNLVQAYGQFSGEELSEAFKRIGKKLGGLLLKTALEGIENREVEKVATIALKYYDKAYAYGLEHKDTQQITHHPFSGSDARQIAAELLSCNP